MQSQVYWRCLQQRPQHAGVARRMLTSPCAQSRVRAKARRRAIGEGHSPTHATTREQLHVIYARSAGGPSHASKMSASRSVTLRADQRKRLPKGVHGETHWGCAQIVARAQR
eukprot:scaffold283729_cov33-Tisochrysis_lutea.AAC.1